MKERIFHWISNTITFIFMLLLVGVAFTVLSTKLSGGSPTLFQVQFKTVLSGSMEPGIKTGSVIAVKEDSNTRNYAKNDVITFQDEDILVTHRITEVIKESGKVMYHTKGDNNDREDMNPVHSENIVGHYAGFTVPYLGYAIKFVQSKNGAFLLFIPGLSLIGYSLFIMFRIIDEWDSIKDPKNNQWSTNEENR